MKSKNLIRVILMAAVISILLAIVSCESEPGGTLGKAQTPTQAFEQLYTAVRSKDTANIKKVMSKSTLKFAEGVAGQQKKDLSKVLENGFHRSTMTESLPPIRDERVKDKWGAVEVYIKKDNTWENVRFVMEDGGWKLAIGETWSGAYKSPGKSRTMREKENANAAGKGDLVPYSNSNTNTNVKPIVIDPMKDKKPRK